MLLVNKDNSKATASNEQLLNEKTLILGGQKVAASAAVLTINSSYFSVTFIEMTATVQLFGHCVCCSQFIQTNRQPPLFPF